MNVVLRAIKVSAFRCFAGSQTARLAPITLLVGENSSGKTSLLAMIRALWDVGFGDRTPNFKEDPYDLGSFEEIAHYRVGQKDPAEQFGGGLEFDYTVRRSTQRFQFDTTFGSQWGAPALTQRKVASHDHWIEQNLDKQGHYSLRFGTPRGTWIHTDRYRRPPFPNGDPELLPPLDTILWTIYRHGRVSTSELNIEPIKGSTPLDEESIVGIRRRLEPLISRRRTARLYAERPYASAPVRSQPRRTQDPTRTIQDSEGDHVPSFLAQLSLRHPGVWLRLKKRLEMFGHDAGLFEEIDVHRLGPSDSAPFQIQVSRSERSTVDPKRNLVDVGYGVSQILPIVTELLREDGPRFMLLQQPEVHLHPSAQAAFGMLLCRSVREESRNRQLIVETHSDFIINRVRMAVRDGIGNLTPEDISIIYFERTPKGANMHSIRVDRDGNLLNVPPDYRSFFLKESHWFLGIE